MRERIYSIEWSTHAERQFNKIKDKRLKQQIIEVLEKEIAKNPLRGKPLADPFKGVRSYRLGRLRILYKMYKEKLVIVVLRINHRKNVYKV